jgi:ribosome-associated translation inhibitor RaiA
MHTQVRTVDCTLSGMAARTFERRLGRIERLLPRFDPDLLRLRLVVERHPRRAEYRCSLRLTFKDATLAATRQRADQVRGVLGEAFDHVERQLKRLREARVDRRTQGLPSAMG